MEHVLGTIILKSVWNDTFKYEILYIGTDGIKESGIEFGLYCNLG